uniref:Uncharacterized protein n=1 Tax=Oryza punctata TaxID=4537 RepID=A0A0E0JFC9_ORYPU
MKLRINVYFIPKIKRERKNEEISSSAVCSTLACHVAREAGNPERAGRAIPANHLATASGEEEVTCKVAAAASSSVLEGVFLPERGL